MSSSPSRQHYQSTCCYSFYLFMPRYMWSLMFLTFYTLLCFYAFLTLNRSLYRQCDKIIKNICTVPTWNCKWIYKCMYWSVWWVPSWDRGKQQPIYVTHSVNAILTSTCRAMKGKHYHRPRIFPVELTLPVNGKPGCVCVFDDPPCPSGSVVLWWACRLLCQRSCPAGTRQ